MKTLRIAETAGFCFGVSRSVKMAENMLQDGPCASFGMLIHNEDEIRRLMKSGLRIVRSVEEVQPGERILIRAHGVPPETIRELEKKHAVISDATCPKVQVIHRIVENADRDGRFVIIIGMRQHPEVEAIRARCRDYAVVENPEETESWLTQHPEVWSLPITVVVQTTQTKSNFEDCVNTIKKRCTNADISDTICFATSKRQEEAAALSMACDAMVVIGGRHSANSQHLAEICRQSCENVQFIERPEELDFSILKKFPVVGLTAGASTPAWIIKEVSSKMSDEIRVEEVLEEIPDALVAEETAEEAVQEMENIVVEEAVEAAPVASVEKELSFDEMLEETMKNI